MRWSYLKIPLTHELNRIGPSTRISKMKDKHNYSDIRSKYQKQKSTNTIKSTNKQTNNSINTKKQPMQKQNLSELWWSS